MSVLATQALQLQGEGSLSAEVEQNGVGGSINDSNTRGRWRVHNTLTEDP